MKTFLSLYERVIGGLLRKLLLVLGERFA
jgi:hypothetical protein